nr:retrovirus-related Pol polyprotein from transposon TNT 1-94 [Tanacetum cinerariifolium]
MWSDQEKKIQKIDLLARSLLIQGLSNEIYSLIDSNKTAKDLWDALARHMLGSKYGEHDRKAAVLYEYETFKATEGELLLDTYIRYLQVINDLKKCGYSKDNCELNFKFLNNLQPEWKYILKQNQGDVNDVMGSKKKTVVVTSSPLALIAEKRNVSKSKEKDVVSSDSEGSDADDFSKLKKITTLLAKAFNQRKFYSKPTNNNMRTSSTSQSANKKQESVNTDNKKVEKKDDEKKRDMSRIKCYNCKKEGHFVKDCKKVKVKDYEYYKTKMLLAKKDKDEQIVHIFLWIIDSRCSKHMTGNRALLTNFVEKFLGTVRFGNNDFPVISSYGDMVIGSMTIKKVYYVEGLGNNIFSVGQFCDKVLEVAFRMSTCFVRNEDGVDLLTGLPKMKFEKDPLCSACEQGKTHQKHHKSKIAFASNKPLYLLHIDLCGPMRVENEASDVIISFIKKTQVNLQLQAHAIATACFTQNRSITHKHFDETPYELMNKRKPNIKFFCVFGCRCYLLNDYEDVGKLNEKGGIEVCVGYSKESAAFRIYNKRTRKIHESVNLNFDEISKMASKEFSLEPDLSKLNETGKSSNPLVSQVSKTSKKDLEDLFQDFYNEYFDSSKITKSSTTNVETSINEEVFHEVSESFQGESSSSSLNDDVQQSLEEVIIPQTNTQSISNNKIPNGDEASTSHNIFNKRLEDSYFDASTSFYDPSNVHTYYQPYPHEKKWTKDHPLHKIIGDPKSSVRTKVN